MTPYELEQREAESPNVVVVEAAGELDLTNAGEVEQRLEGLSTSGALLLDLNRVSFIDSAALHVLFRLARRLAPDRFGIVLEPTAAIARTLSIVGLDDVVTVRASAGELLSELSA